MDINFESNCNPDPQCTLCTGDKTDNIFCVPRAPGFPPRCILDEMTYQQVYEILGRIPKAKGDLMRITSDPILLELARTTRLIEPPQDESLRVQRRLNANSIPYYTSMRGNIDGSKC